MQRERVQKEGERELKARMEQQEKNERQGGMAAAAAARIQQQGRAHVVCI
jgi:hypothetical protein